MLSESEVRQCMEPPYGVCPISITRLFTAESKNCAYDMYSRDNEKIKELCQQTTLTSFQTPALYPEINGNFWVYSIPHTIQVILHCHTFPNTIKGKEIKSIFLTGTDILNNTKNCHIFFKLFTLLPHTSGMSSIDIQPRHIMIPPIESSDTEIIEFLDILHTTLNTNQLTDLQSIINNSADADVITSKSLQRKL